jgi:hypothetical protein
VELFATILLAVAAVASTFQSTQWRGEQAAQTSRSAATRIQSASASTRAGQLTQIDVATFIQWVDADVAGNTELATFYRQRLREELHSVCTKLQSVRQREVLLGLGALMFLSAAVWIATRPVSFVS